jgi:hypothetical protein
MLEIQKHLLKNMIENDVFYLIQEQ